jgi:hypothetical protein
MTTGRHGEREVGGKRSEAGAEDTGCDYDAKIHVIENATEAMARPAARSRAAGTATITLAYLGAIGHFS